MKRGNDSDFGGQIFQGRTRPMLASLLLASSALCSMAMPAQAAAQAGNSFNIPAQPLGDALADSERNRNFRSA
jgi:hypothetical protein